MRLVLAAAAAAFVLAPAAHAAPAGVPILMYHVIGTAPVTAPYAHLYVSPRDFRRQMRWLHRNGWHAVTLDEVYASWKIGTKLPARPVVISFDDGYRGDATIAAHVLRRYGWPGVLNLEVANMGVRGGLPARHVRGLIREGWEVDAHTLTHPDLTLVDSARLEREVAGSREVLRARFHVPVDFFCYPAGRYDDAVLAAVRSAGYLGATTERPGLALPTELYTLARIRVNGGETLAEFASTLQAST